MVSKNKAKLHAQMRRFNPFLLQHLNQLNNSNLVFNVYEGLKSVYLGPNDALNSLNPGAGVIITSFCSLQDPFSNFVFVCELMNQTCYLVTKLYSLQIPGLCLCVCVVLSPQVHPGVWMSGSLCVFHHPCSPGILLTLPPHSGRSRTYKQTHSNKSGCRGI